MANPVTLVTGANRGVGYEVCRQLADLDHTVLLSARDGEKAKSAAGKLAEAGRDVRPLQLDVVNPESVEWARRWVENEVGRLDALVNNAAIDYDSDQEVLSADLERVRDAFETNVLGVWRVTLAFLPLLRKSEHPRIVNVTSGSGTLNSMTGSTPAYSLSKAALNALTMMMDSALTGSGVLVNAIDPGWVATDMGGPGGRPVEAGGESVVWGVTLPDDGPSGGFYRHGIRREW